MRDGGEVAWELAPDDQFVADWRVRRRCYDGRVVLVQHNDVVEVDSAADLVFRSCAEPASLRELSAEVARHTGWPAPEALAATVWAVGHLVELGLVARSSS